MYITFQSIPRTILLGESGRQLVQWPIKEIEKLRTKQVSFDDMDLESGSIFEVPGITAAQVTIPRYSLFQSYKDLNFLPQTNSQRKAELLVEVMKTFSHLFAVCKGRHRNFVPLIGS